MIAVLLERLPVIGQFFSVHKKVGEGTFSNVFVATTKATIAEKKKFAIKHLTSTSHPSRIIQEIKCLQDIGYIEISYIPFLIICIFYFFNCILCSLQR